MEKFHRFSSRIVIILAVALAILMMTNRLSPAYCYLGIGVLFTYIGLQNMILLNLGQRSGQMPAKIAYLVQRHGHNRGIIQYVIVNVLLFLLLGISVVIGAWQQLHL